MTNKQVNKDRRRIVKGFGTVAATIALPQRLSAQTENDTDVLIIGGGIAGTSTAFHLAEHGRNVILLERGEIASEASGQNMGGLGGSGWGNNPNLLSYLTAGSVEIFKRMHIDMSYDMEFLSAREACAIEPEASDKLPGYMYRPQRGQADPIKTTRAFAHAAAVAGATINTGHNVVSITSMSAGGYSIQTESSEFRCQT